MSKKVKFFGSFEKMEEQDDGTVKVYGYASSEAVDAHGEVVKASAMENALGDYMKFANVREMHQPIAAGNCIEATVQDDGRTWFGAHVIDPVAVKKVQTGVYKGFSIGGFVTDRDKADKTIITQLRLNEVSLVDRPANPDSVFTMWKMEDQPVGKGMYTVARFAELIESVNSLRQSTEWEAEYEGDNSPIPNRLKQLVNDLADCFKDMVDEETAELVSNADKEGDMKKLDDIPGAREEVKKMIDDARSETREVVEKEFNGKVEALTGELAKSNETLTKAAETITALSDRLTKLESQPTPPKAAIRSVEKGDETGVTDDAEKITIVKNNDGSINAAATLIKAVHQRPSVVA